MKQPLPGVTPELILAVRILFYATLLPAFIYLSACDSGGSTPTPPPRLRPAEQRWFDHAEMFFGVDVDQPTYVYEAPVPCGNGATCCAAGCQPSVGQSCYWPETKRVIVADAEGFPCASVDFKLRVESCNAVWCQVHPDLCDAPDQYNQPCAG